MSIPRLAIQRPVTMFMLSAVVVLLGAISLTRLPVDLMPEFALPTISVSVNYPGVGPLEMEQLITRPLEQSVSAVAGLQHRHLVERLVHEGVVVPHGGDAEDALLPEVVLGDLGDGDVELRLHPVDGGADEACAAAHC